MNFRSVALRLLLLAALTGPARPQASDPPLPGEDDTTTGGFLPLLQPGDNLPPGSKAPDTPESTPDLPPGLFPDEALGPDENGKIPGLILPEDAVDEPGQVPAAPAGKADPDSLLPPPSLPGMELATNAYWHKNPREARALAQKEKKPLLILFCFDKKTSFAVPGRGTTNPLGDLDADLLSSTEFKEFAAGHVILTRLLYPTGSINEREYPEAKMQALKSFRSWFKVKGLPCLLLLDENGREIERISKYSRVRGRDGEYYSAAPPLLDRLKLAVHRREQVIATNKARMESLRAQNYREWTSAIGTTLLAKLVSASEQRIVLMNENGALYRVSPPQLSIIDRYWIRRTQTRENLAGSPATASPIAPSPQ